MLLLATDPSLIRYAGSFEVHWANLFDLLVE
jgi:hypothetical protein